MNTRPQHDAIDTIQHLGYSEREAAFLYTVAVYPGISCGANSICSSSENAAPSPRNFCARQDGAATFGKFSVSRAGLSIRFCQVPLPDRQPGRIRGIVAPRAHEKSDAG